MKSKKSERIHIRLTPAEKEKIEAGAFKARMSVSEYIVALAEDKPIVVVDDMARLIMETIRVGTNVNQISKIANSQKFIKREQIERVENEMKEIHDMIYAISRKIDRGAETENNGDSEICGE